MIEFQLDTVSGVATYLQLAQQVRHALRLGLLGPATSCRPPSRSSPGWRSTRTRCSRPTGTWSGRAWSGPGRARARSSSGRCPAPTPPRRRRLLASMTEWLAAARPAGLDRTISRRSTGPRSATTSRRGSRDHRPRGQRPRQALRAAAGAARLHPDRPRRAGHRAGRAQRGGQDHAAATGGRAARADLGHDQRPRRPPGADPAQLGRVGFVAQDAPLYAGPYRRRPPADGRAGSTRAGTRAGRAPHQQLGLDPSQRAGSLSGGQRAQLALTLAIAKRPELLLLDEPVASLDPLARREFLQDLMEVVAEQGSASCCPRT